MIQFDQEVCGNLNAASTREWLETNGLGGFAATTGGGSAKGGAGEHARGGRAPEEPACARAIEGGHTALRRSRSRGANSEISIPISQGETIEFDVRWLLLGTIF